MNMNENMNQYDIIRKFVRKAVIGKDVELSETGELAPTVAGCKIIRTDESDIPELVRVLTEASRSGNTLVAVQNEAVAGLCSALNRTYDRGKLIVMCGGKMDDKAFMEEINSKMLHDESGSLNLLPEPTEHPALFSDGDRVLIRSRIRPEGSMHPIYGADGAYWGELMSEKMNIKDYAGTLAAISAKLSDAERDAIISQLDATEYTAAPESILIFRAETEMFAVPLPDAAQIPADDLRLHLLTGLPSAAGTVKILQALCKCSNLRLGIQLAARYCPNII